MESLLHTMYWQKELHCSKVRIYMNEKKKHPNHTEPRVDVSSS